MLFAHGGEEIEYLELNSIECEVIPGISAGLAAASISKIPLTYRNLSSSVTLFTGHTEQIPKLAVGGTLVMYMAASKLGLIAASLVNKGWNPETPVALLHNVSLPGGSERITTLSAISHPDFKAVSPLIVIVGEVVAHKSRVGKRDVWKRIVGSRHGVSLTECPG
jgi:siroheme synthase